MHLSEDCALLLKKAKDVVKVDQIDDPHYRVVVDYVEVTEGRKPENT